MKAPSKKDRGYRPTVESSRGKETFYQSTEWRNLRKELKIEQRSKDLHIARQLYKNNPNIDLNYYNRFIDSDNPLCVHCIDHKRITGANTLDHITPIRLGGAPLDRNNLQWLCERCHARKSQSERGKQANDVNNISKSEYSKKANAEYRRRRGKQ